MRRLGEKNDRTLMRVALSGQSGEQETIICDIEQIVRLHAYGAGTYRKAATDTRKWLSLYGASKRSMTSTHSPSSLLRVPRRRQEGSERVSLKLFSDDKDCILYSPANMVALPDAVFELVVAEVKTRTAEDDYYSFNAVTNMHLQYSRCLYQQEEPWVSIWRGK